jgi:hypothetical protein
MPYTAWLRSCYFASDPERGENFAVGGVFYNRAFLPESKVFSPI